MSIISFHFFFNIFFFVSHQKRAMYLRSAVLSKDELTHEVLHRSKADMPKPREASLFTTKLMMRLASR